MSDAEVREVLGTVLAIAPRVGARVLIGILRRSPGEMLACIQETVTWLCDRAGEASPLTAMCKLHVCGFTVCPPAGAKLGEHAIEQSLTEILRLNLPVALYQLPQVTQNEMTPDTVARLAAAFPNFYLFKDTSGSDRVARSGSDFGDVFLVRGAEGRYAEWLKPVGGRYDGFLLSTANVFGDHYDAMIRLQREGSHAAAVERIRPVEEMVERAFRCVADLPFGNPFTNANKAIDHHLAHGSHASQAPAPLVCDGQSLPRDLLSQIGQWLAELQLLTAQGYLADEPDARASC
jgi:hypothetical protein